MPTLRKRTDFAAAIHTLEGSAMSDCHVYAEIETTVEGGARVVRWQGKFTSLSHPELSFRGDYLMRVDGADSAITVHNGSQDRLGITSDEYEFWGDGAPPELS